MHPLDDTIAAISSAPGGAARGIVRLSGPGVLACLRPYFHAEGDAADAVSADAALAAPRAATAICGSFRLPDLASPLPGELYVWPDGHSYTGGPMAEIHTLGSPPLLQGLLAALCAAGARLAEPGEFTLRAFLTGRIDLTQAEAVLGVIDAADPNQLQAALAQLAGGLAGPLHRLRELLIELLAHLEAGFDFADEDLSFLTAQQLNGQLDEAIDHVARLVGQMASRSEAGEAFRAVLIGRPNSGKSSLFNALARDAGALVSELPGTTRDYLTAEIDLDGVKCQLIDTAGIDTAGIDAVPDAIDPDDASSHAIERAAQAAAREQHRRADVQILCLDSTQPDDALPSEEAVRAGVEQIVVSTKIDLGGPLPDMPQALPTSSVTGQGIDALRDRLRRAAIAAEVAGGEVVAGTAVRCRQSLRLAGESLARAREISRYEQGEELVAAEIRIALEALGQVVGAVYTDDLLERIFSRFCVGK